MRNVGKLILFLENIRKTWEIFENLTNSYNDFASFKTSALIDVLVKYILARPRWRCPPCPPPPPPRHVPSVPRCTLRPWLYVYIRRVECRRTVDSRPQTPRLRGDTWEGWAPCVFGVSANALTLNINYINRNTYIN